MLDRAAMRIWFATFSVLLVAFSLLSAGISNAASTPCAPDETHALGHVESGTAEMPSCPLSGTTHHHHSQCGHQTAASDESSSSFGGFADSNLMPPAPAIALTSRGPPSLLRPPIA